MKEKEGTLRVIPPTGTTVYGFRTSCSRRFNIRIGLDLDQRGNIKIEKNILPVKGCLQQVMLLMEPFWSSLP